ncbi:fumarylacetoacetate hydrolase family protein [Oryzicola mucosus]|nr:fumarylacetoacetate hydrolase family protein [Oryzicola mucosus]
MVDIASRGRAALTDLSSSGGVEVPFDRSALRAPVQRFRRDILCAGWNYWDHFEEGKGRREGQDVERPEHPTFFTKGPDTVIDPDAPISFDAEISSKWDYEVELALIIGKDGRNIPVESALDHVFGYCLANDISQRDLQRAHGGQWLKGKSIDATMPLGPYIVTADEVDPQDLTLECVVNGEVLQSASTKLMAFTVAQLLSELSFGMTLRAGDVLLTGTPAGVGNARTPQLFLKAGDEVICRSPQLGELRNVMQAADLHSPR